MKTINVYILAGQSNMVGYRSDHSEFTPDSTDSEIYYNYGGAHPPDVYGDNSGQVGRTPFAPIVKNADGFGFTDQSHQIPSGESWFGFGPELRIGQIAKESFDDVAMLKFSIGNTKLETEWHPTTGNYSNTLVTRINDLRTTLEGLGFNVVFKAFVWWQGESDSGSFDYKYYLKSLITRIKATTLMPRLPVVICLTPAGHANTVTAQQEITQEVVSTFNYDPDGLPVFTDNVHYWQDAHITSGNDISQILSTVGAV